MTFNDSAQLDTSQVQSGGSSGGGGGGGGFPGGIQVGGGIGGLILLVLSLIFGGNVLGGGGSDGSSSGGLPSQQLQRDLEELHRRGYRPVNMTDVVDKKIQQLPRGISPVVLVFDDASPSQFRYIEQGGKLVIDPTSAVGILEKFADRHPDWPRRGVFCMLPAAEVVPHARRVAERFNQLPPGAVRESKRLMRAPLAAQLIPTIEKEAEIFGQRLRSPEAREAFQAFFEKRKPDFSKF